MPLLHLRNISINNNSFSSVQTFQITRFSSIFQPYGAVGLCLSVCVVSAQYACDFKADPRRLNKPPGVSVCLSVYTCVCMRARTSLLGVLSDAGSGSRLELGLCWHIKSLVLYRAAGWLWLAHLEGLSTDSGTVHRCL